MRIIPLSDVRYEAVFPIFPIKAGVYGYSFDFYESTKNQKKNQPYCTRVFFDSKLYVKITKNVKDFLKFLILLNLLLDKIR